MTLMAVNALADATMRADSPTVAAMTWMVEAVWTPATDTSPARRPCVLLRVTMNSTAGPGIMSSRSDATMNVATVGVDGMIAP